MAHFVLERAFGGLRRRVENFAVDIHLPAVIDAAQAAFFVPPEKQRCTAVRAMLIEQSNSPLAVTKSDQIFAEQTNAHGWAIRFWNLARQ